MRTNGRTRRTAVVTLLGLQSLTFAACTSPTGPDETGDMIEVSIFVRERTAADPLGPTTPLSGVRIETAGGPAPGLVATWVGGGHYRLQVPKGREYTCHISVCVDHYQRIRLSRDGYETLEAHIGGRVDPSYFFYMNPPPHSLTAYNVASPGLEVEILSGPNAGRRTVSVAHGGSASFYFEGLQASPPFRLRIGDDIRIFQGESHPSDVSNGASILPVAGLYHHAIFNLRR